MDRGRVVLMLASALSLALGLSAEEPARGIALKPDPPIAVDGDLGEWSDIPNRIALDRADQVVWGAAAWQSLDDFSGAVHLAWRQEHLFIAADVRDDVVSQTQRGQGIWKGDHVEMYLDTQPDLEPDRDTYGEEIFHLGFSPGNFLSTGDPFADCPPEAFCFRPESKALSGVLVASTRTENGWTLEAAIPWGVLGLEKPREGTVFRFELAISDTDSGTAQQESLMATSSAPWGHRRSRLTQAVLAASDGVAPEIARRILVFDTLRLERGEKQSFVFDAPRIPEGKDAFLTLQARLHTAKVAGHTPALHLTLNGQPISFDRLQNKPLRIKARDGRVFTMAAGDRFSTFYTPDFAKVDLDPQYGLLGGVKACRFDLRVTDLLEEGENELLVSHKAADSVDNPLVAADAAIAFRTPPPPPKPKAGPPTGALDRVEPRALLKTDYAARDRSGGKIEITVGGETFLVESRFSSPEPAWERGSCRFFKHERRIERNAEAILVHDTFTNLTDEPLALMQRHYVHLGEAMKRAWAAGLEQAGLSGKTAVPANPTTYAATEAHGIGFAALSDVFRVHVTNYIVDGDMGVADNNLVLPPGAEYTAEWAIVPTDTPDYWAFINAARRIVGANFRIDGAFAFFRADHHTESWSDTQVTEFIRFKDARYVCSSITYPRYNGHYTHGTAFQRVSHDNYRQAIERRRKLVPEAQYLVYFHCFLDVTEDGPERFADARTLGPDGTQATYGKDYDRLYCPTESNSYGPAIEKNVDIILDEIGADGVYWDEHEYSRLAYHYGDPWDGFSGDIDPKSMTVKRLKSSVTLLSESWRVALAKRIQSRGPLIGNGAPFTRAMAALQFPCFIETGSITNCTRGHLYSPIALGDHLTERSEEDAYAVMLGALEYGCVYHWYNDLLVIPTHHHLTRYMYPITPKELHQGYIIGEERIITKKSGLFGWGDTSTHEVHVFDDTAREVMDFHAPLVTLDGKTYTELRIGEDWSAAIIRK